MRINLKKFLFLGLQTDRKTFFNKAQQLGIVHFIDAKRSTKIDLPCDIDHCTKAIKVLRTLPEVKQVSLADQLTAEDVISDILHLKDRCDELVDYTRKLNGELSVIVNLGHYSQDDLLWIESEGQCKIQFFSAKTGIFEKENIPAVSVACGVSQQESAKRSRNNHGVIYDNLLHIATAEGLDYYMAINEQSRQYRKMTEIKPARELACLQHERDLAIEESHQIHLKLKNYAKYQEAIYHELGHRISQHHLTEADKLASLSTDETIFAISGWVPESQMNAIDDLALKLHVHIEEVAIEPTDTVPTFLQNEGANRIGEDLVKIYDVPSKDDVDPSLWVLGFFALFFSIIVGDAGYGLVLLLAAIFVRCKAGNITNFGQRMLNLLFILSGGIILWGILMTSFFGITFAPDSSVRNVSALSWLVEKKTAYHFEMQDSVSAEWIKDFPILKEMHDPIEILNNAIIVSKSTGRITYEMYNSIADNLMLEMALFIGVVHIIISLLRYLNRNIAALGWIAFLIGGYLYAPSFLEAVSFPEYIFGIDPTKASIWGLYLMGGGIGFSLIVNLYKYKLTGLFESISFVLQIFSDVMSYLRLYALGLSGALITATVNDLIDGMNIILAALLLIVAHTVNLTLAVMGGVIHGLRLNFLEWYHYSFEGGGKQFNPLKKIEIE